jgi:hypothetical protein
LACIGMHWHALACIDMRWHAVACSGMQWHAVACIGMHGHAWTCIGMLRAPCIYIYIYIYRYGFWTITVPYTCGGIPQDSTSEHRGSREPLPGQMGLVTGSWCNVCSENRFCDRTLGSKGACGVQLPLRRARTGSRAL